MLRVLLITHPDLASSPTRSESSLVRTFVGLANVSVVSWDDLSSPSVRNAAALAGGATSDFDVCVVFVRFRLLRAADAFDWSGFGGGRVWLEHDAWNNYSPAHRSWWGSYPEAYRRHRFGLMVSSGKVTTELLRRDGVRCQWIPKGYSQEVFSDLRGERSGICTFGTMWPSRRALAHRLTRAGVPIVDVSGSFDGLNERLNRHTAGIVCNMPGAAPFGRVGRAANRVLPTFVRTWPAVEPMIKTFETAAAGCAPILDHLSELDDLGFVDRKNCYVYRSFNEAVDLARSLAEDEAVGIGRAAAELARSRHTWAARAAELSAALEQFA